MKGSVTLAVGAIHVFCQVLLALEHLFEVFAVDRSDKGEEEWPMDDRLTGEDPEKAFGCVVKVSVVWPAVKFPRREDCQEVRESDAKEDAELYKIFIFP